MKKYLKSTGIIAAVLILAMVYLGTVVKPNMNQKKIYDDCVKEAITAEDAKHLNYIGSVRDDSSNPKTCSYTQGRTVTEFKGNVFLP